MEFDTVKIIITGLNEKGNIHAKPSESFITIALRHTSFSTSLSLLPP
jgi:hypothetical protein